MAKSFIVKDMEDLSTRDMEALTVTGLGPEVKDKMAEAGAKQGEVAACVVMKCKDGKVAGARWVLTGSLGQVSISTHRLGGERGHKVKVDLGDLTKFSFPGDGDPREACNKSDWVEAGSLAVDMIANGARTKDPKEILDNDYMKKGGFSLRVIVLPLSPGSVCIWVGAAPGTPAMIKDAAGKNGVSEHSGGVPTVCVSLKKKSHEIVGSMVPKEKSLGLARKWVIYPLLMK